MKRHATSIVLGIVSFALGSAVTRYYDTHGRAVLSAADSTRSETETADRAAVNGSPGTAAIDFTREPLCAYGFERPPAPGEQAAPQNPPSRNLRPNEDPVEQTRPRHVEGSTASYSLVDIRDGQNV